MSIRVRQRYMDMLDSIKEALTYIENNMKEDILEVFIDCQNLIIAMGTGLEEIDAEPRIIHMLEEIAELIYHISCMQSEAYRDGSKVECLELKRIFEKSEQLIDEIVPIMNQDNNFKSEVLFLPYKASMWDSMHSVYLAAQEDDGWNAVVMPIPYYSLNEKEKRVKECYEGAGFPKELKVMDYREYHLDQRLPDVIVIHNPYDEYNRITRVHADYYSGKLKEITHRLVYIPYYVLDADGQFTDAQCMLPGVVNAWRIFVESERAKAAYSKVVDKSKVLALGSPKLDMLQLPVNAVPESWAVVSEGKTVFLYNTHLVNVMHNIPFHFQKIVSVLSFFEKRPDIILLWRPHPLMKETLGAFSPDYLESFDHVVAFAKSIPNVILDNTPDLYRSIEMSDAYIGDASSVVTLYKKTQKPLWITTEEYNVLHYMTVFSIIADGHYIWFFSNRLNALFRMNLSNREVAYITTFWGEDFAGAFLYRDMIEYKDKLYFLPNMAKTMAIYHKQSGVVTYWDIKREEDDNLYEAVQIQQMLWLIPKRPDTPCIILDLDKESVEYMESPAKLIKYPSREEPIWFGKPTYHEGLIWIPVLVKNAVISLDVTTREYYFHLVGRKSGCFIAGAIVDNEYWLVPHVGSTLTKWNLNSKRCEYFNHWPKDFNPGEEFSFSDIHIEMDDIWLVPRQANMIVRMDRVSKEAQGVSFDSLDIRRDETYRYFFFKPVVAKGELYIFPIKEGKALQIDLKEKIIEPFDLDYPQQWQELFMEQYLEHFDFKKNNHKHMILSEKNCSVELFINAVVDSTQQIVHKQNLQGNPKTSLIGTKIWEEIKSAIK